MLTCSLSKYASVCGDELLVWLLWLHLLEIRAQLLWDTAPGPLWPQRARFTAYQSVSVTILISILWCKTESNM